MSSKEMTKIFSVMMLAWPNAKLFEGGPQQLRPAIRLWTECAREVDFATGQQVIAQLCRESKYPPTIAEFLERAREWEEDQRAQVREALWTIRTADQWEGLEAFFARLPEGEPIKTAMEKMGGPQAMLIPMDIGGARWNTAGFEAAYRQAVLSAPDREALPGEAAPPALGPGWDSPDPAGPEWAGCV